MTLTDISPFIVWGISIVALIYSAVQYCSVKKHDEGNDLMKAIGEKIRGGAMAYLKRQYKTVGIFFVIMFAILVVAMLVPQISVIAVIIMIFGMKISAFLQPLINKYITSKIFKERR